MLARYTNTVTRFYLNLHITDIRLLMIIKLVTYVSKLYQNDSMFLFKSSHK